MRYVDWVTLVLHAVLRTEDGRGGTASLATIGIALGFDATQLRYEGRPEEGSPASAIVTALSDLASEGWVEFQSVSMGARSTSAGRDLAGRGVVEQWVRWFEDIYLDANAEALLVRLARFSERQGPKSADAAWVEVDVVYREGGPSVEPDEVEVVMTMMATINDLAGKQLIEARAYGGGTASARINYRGMVRASERPQAVIARRAGLVDWSTPSPGWEEIEDRLQQMIERFTTATELDDFQDVGRRGRELLIDLATKLFEASMVPTGQEVPGPSDAKGRMEHYINARLAGGTNENLRGFMNKTHALANALAHSRTMGRTEAYACTQAMVLLIRAGQMVEADQGREC